MTEEGRLPDRQQADRRLDVSGELCPMPVVRARAVLATMQPGQTLEVLATDPLAELDLAVMCERSGHRLLESSSRSDFVRVRIEAGPDSRTVHE